MISQLRILCIIQLLVKVAGSLRHASRQGIIQNPAPNRDLIEIEHNHTLSKYTKSPKSPKSSRSTKKCNKKHKNHKSHKSKHLPKSDKLDDRSSISSKSSKSRRGLNLYFQNFHPVVTEEIKTAPTNEPSMSPSTEWTYTTYDENSHIIDFHDEYEECTSEPSQSPSISNTPTISDVPSGSPTISLMPSTSPTTSKTPSMSPVPTDEPSDTHSTSPSNLPSVYPSADPTVSFLPSSDPSTNPSASPSVSLQPSDMPSTEPSDIPSTEPSGVPSTEPSDIPSTEPSTEPSNIPSTEPSDIPSTELSDIPSTEPSNTPSTSSIPSDIPSTSKLSVVISGRYRYEMETPQSPAGMDDVDYLESIASSIEADVLNPDIVGSPSRKLGSAASLISNTGISHQRQVLERFTTGCKSLGLDGSSSRCHVVSAVYDYGYFLETDSHSDEELTEHLLLSIRDNMATMNGLVQDGYKALFVGGFINGNFQTAAQISSAELAVIGPPESRTLSIAGIGMVTAGCILIVVFIFVVARKKRHRDVHIKEGILDDDLLFGKSSKTLGLHSYTGYSDYDTDHISIASSNRRQHVVHVIGEEESVFSSSSFEQDGRLYGLGPSPRSIMDMNQHGNNVHKCTSTTCPICAKDQSPTFVASDGLAAVDENNLLQLENDLEQLESMEKRTFVAPDTIDI